MSASSKSSTGVSGTVNAFNFIRRIGFPTTANIITIFATLIALSTILSLPLSGLTGGSTLLVAASGIILPTLAGEFLCAVVILRGDPVLNFRRLMGMETVSWFPILLLLPIYSLTGTLYGDKTLWMHGLIASIAVSLPMRFLTIYSMSKLTQMRKLAGSVITPVVAVPTLFVVTNRLVSATGSSSRASLDRIATEVPSLLLLLLVGVLSWIAVSRIIRNVDREGADAIGDEPMGLFRDFLRHWLEGERGPLESRLAALGRTGKIDVSTLAFESSTGSKSAIIISNFHPGPYRDLGSGGLPSMLKSEVQRTKGSIIMVPHGISNHEYNIISQEGILKLINETSRNYPYSADRNKCSIMVREVSGEAKATAQIFGDTAFLTLTLAPVDMEDIPSNVREELEAAGRKKGLNVIVADAHNSLKNQVSITERQAEMLRDAGIQALVKAIQLPLLPFQVGAATDPLKEFKIEEGIGPGGVSALVIESNGQRSAYIVIDGNNMRYGFRQILLESIQTEGVNDGEVMTTDTHLVAGVVRSPLGYYPVGDGIDQGALISRVKEVVSIAASQLGLGSSGYSTFSLTLQVLGSASFQSITSFVGRIAGRIGQSFLRLEVIVVVLSVVVTLVI